MAVVHISPEIGPWVRTGGLGDVVGALPHALARQGTPSAVVAPLHRAARRAIAAAGRTLEHVCDLGGPELPGVGPLRLLELAGAGPARVFFVDLPWAFDRDGIYGHGDDAFRFATFTRVALRAADHVFGADLRIVHAHDWTTALAPLYLRGPDALPSRPASVLSIHNLAYQGVFPKDELPYLGLAWDWFRWDRLEFWDQLNFLKGGIGEADAICTVSPSYAREITTAAYGQQLDAHLRGQGARLRGILNGLDTADWDPATDPALPAPYSAIDPSGKAASRAALLQAFGLPPDPGRPVLAVVSCFTAQKGLDLVADLAPWMVEQGAVLAVLGTGDRDLERRFARLGRDPAIGVRVAFDSDLARLLIAGSDCLLVPSRFEPCGLTQLQAMRYGAVPVVCATGGLRDTVQDPGDQGLMAGGGSGFRFEHASVEGLRWALDRALRCFAGDPEGWARLRRSVMERDWSWTGPAARYAELYDSLRR